MDLSFPLEELNVQFIGFNNAVPNSIIEGGLFNRIYYSNQYITTNGINVFCKIGDIRLDRYYNKFKIWFDYEKNNTMLSKIFDMEKKILYKINIRNKTPILKLTDHFNNKNIKTSTMLNDAEGLCIKISGIWQTKTNFGLTFRFQLANSYVLPFN